MKISVQGIHAQTTYQITYSAHSPVPSPHSWTCSLLELSIDLHPDSAESQILFLTETLRVNLRCKWMKSSSIYSLPSWLAIDWLLYSHYSTKSSGKKPSIYVNGIKIIKCKSTLYPRSAVSERWFKFISAALNCPHSKKARTLWRRKKAAALVELALLTSQCLSNFIKLVQ